MPSAAVAAVKSRGRDLAQRSAARLGVQIVRNTYPKRLGRLFDVLGIDVVIDIGANEGQYACYLRRYANYDGRIISVEPLSAPFARLAGLAASDPAWDVVRAGASSEVGVMTLNVAGNSVSSSPLPMLDLQTRADPHSAYVGREEAPATTIDALVAEYRVDPARALLKVDVQGFEAAVLDGAAGTLERFPAVALELAIAPLYDGQILMPELVARMDRAGFDLWIVEPGFWQPATSRTLECDGVFVRRGTVADA